MIIKSIYSITFENDNRYYLFNSQTLFFSEISSELYKVINESTWDSLQEDELKELINRKILLDETNIYDYYYSAIFQFQARNFDKSTLSLVIAPTTSCNFACPYCFEPKLTPKTMTDSIIDKLVEFVKGHEEAKGINLTWYGGEPLLAFDKIKKLYKALSQEGMPEISYQSIITNAYHFNEEVIEFFKTNKLNHIQISLDGIKSRHDKTRCLRVSHEPTFDVIWDNMKKIVKELPDTNVNVRVNINRSNYEDFISIYNELKEQFPNKNIGAYPGMIREETEDGKCLCNDSFTTRDTIELNALLKERGLQPVFFPTKTNKGCMMHFNNSYIIGPEGEIYKCWNDVSDDKKVIGNISSKILSNSSRFFKYSTQAVPFNDECKNCHAFPVCDGGCAYHRYRNMFEDCHYELCSSYKDLETLKYALLNGEFQSQIQG